MIDLSDYNMTMRTTYNWIPYSSRDIITLVPVLNNRRWKIDIPDNQNLGRHMFPYQMIKLDW